MVASKNRARTPDAEILCASLAQRGCKRVRNDEFHKLNLEQEELIVAGNEDLMRVGCALRQDTFMVVNAASSAGAASWSLKGL